MTVSVSLKHQKCVIMRSCYPGLCFYSSTLPMNRTIHLSQYSEWIDSEWTGQLLINNDPWIAILHCHWCIDLLIREVLNVVFISGCPLWFKCFMSCWERITFVCTCFMYIRWSKYKYFVSCLTLKHKRTQTPYSHNYISFLLVLVNN